MIVVHHSVGLFGIEPMGVNFGQGVTFFFVLSGFILTYVYPELPTGAATMRFWRARVARVWPAHVASLVLGLVLLQYGWDTSTAIANLLMVQAWIPVSKYYFSYNAVSWSISAEFFFYLAFPFLLYKWDSTWRIKLAASGLIVVLLVVMVTVLALPSYGHSAVPADAVKVTQHGILYINPVTRIFEFHRRHVRCALLGARRGRRHLRRTRSPAPNSSHSGFASPW